MLTYDDIIQSCKAKIRYGDLWKEFTTEELIQYGFIKAKRGLILLKTHQKNSSLDDLEDSINILVMAIQRINLEDNSEN
jgi:hypothetical protein